MEFQQGKHDLTRRGLPEVDPANVDRFLGAANEAGAVAVLLSMGDPTRFMEAIDVAVVLPELIDAFRGRLRGAVIARRAESELGQRFGVRVQPTLIFVAKGETLGLIAKIQDWPVYVDRIAKLIDLRAAGECCCDTHHSPASLTGCRTMNAGFWTAPGAAEQPINVFPFGEESLNVSSGSLTAAGALAKLATLDGAELAKRCPNAIDLLSKVVVAISRQKTDAPTRLFRLGNLDDLERKLIADVLGEGEVAGFVALPDGSMAQIQESVLTGIWHVRLETDADHEYLEVGAIPEIVKRAAADLTTADFEIGQAPEGAMNALPVLAEIRERALAWRPSIRSQIINFTLLPMSPVDMSFLQDTIRNGPVQLVSRGYGTCRVLSTAIRNVWSVQFFNAMDAIILDTLEVGGVPTVAIAADEDFEDSAERLQEIIEAYFK